MSDPTEIESLDPTPLEYELRQIACRLVEVHGLDSVVILACKQRTTDSGYVTTNSHGNAGNHYAGKHLARRYSET